MAEPIPDDIPSDDELTRRRALRDAKADRIAQFKTVAQVSESERLMGLIGPGLARWEGQIRDMWANRCPPCTVGSASFEACEYRFRADLMGKAPDDKPICHLHELRVPYEVQQSRTRFRLARMKEAGIVSAELLRIVPPCRTVDDVLPTAALGHLTEKEREIYLRAPRAIVAAAKKFLSGGARHLILRGPKGILKTTVAAAIVAERTGAVWLTMSRLQPNAAGDAARERAEKAPLLVLNDVGTEAASEFHRSLLAQIVTERDDNNLPMVVTSNLTDEQISTNYRDSNWDRLQRGIDCNVTGLSLRQVLDGGTP